MVLRSEATAEADELIEHCRALIASYKKPKRIEFLGELPLDQAIREGGDSGVPIVVGQPDSELAAAFRSIAEQVAARCSVLQCSGEESGVQPDRAPERIPL